jgi:hypothetical protein
VPREERPKLNKRYLSSVEMISPHLIEDELAFSLHTHMIAGEAVLLLLSPFELLRHKLEFERVQNPLQRALWV